MGNTESKFRMAVTGWRNRHSYTVRTQYEIPEVGDRRADGPAESEHINEIDKQTTLYVAKYLCTRREQ